MKTRVLIVDDSALVRQLLTDLLSRNRDIDVVGAAQDPFVARDMIKQLRPDVITLDVEMPRMDGLTFLDNLMRLHPLPVVMVSSLTQAGADATLEALALGAVDFVAKPKLDVARGLTAYADELISKVLDAARAKPRSRAQPSTKVSVERKPLTYRTTDRLIAIGASAGGTEAIRVVLESMPANAPGIVITQHIPAEFSRAFAERMDRTCAMKVCEAQDEQQVVPGHVFIAPGGRHLRIERSGARWMCRLGDDAPISRHRPSVDALFRSVAQAAGHNAVAAILTGMGDDGARGMAELRATGVATIAQDEATSVVWGMPGAAVKAGGVDEVLPLTKIGPRLIDLIGIAARKCVAVPT